VCIWCIGLKNSQRQTPNEEVEGLGFVGVQKFSDVFDPSMGDIFTAYSINISRRVCVLEFGEIRPRTSRLPKEGEVSVGVGIDQQPRVMRHERSKQ
jgi:hypothetical protein